MPGNGIELAGRKGGKRLRLRCLDDLDKRTNAARSALALRDSLVEDLGGADALTVMEMALVDNVVLLGTALADMAASYLSGEPIDLGAYATAANAQRRLLADLGLERRARDITPPTSLHEHIRRRTSGAHAA